MDISLILLQNQQACAVGLGGIAVKKTFKTGQITNNLSVNVYYFKKKVVRVGECT